MKIYAIIRSAIPNATDEICEHILWGRTTYPMGVITARSLYGAAKRFDRANKKNIRLCDFCDRIVRENRTECDICAQCRKALLTTNDHIILKT